MVDSMENTLVGRAEVARRLWHDYLKVEYYELSDLAQAEWRVESATHSLPRYYADGKRVVGAPHGDVFIDKTYAEQHVRDDHYAVRTYALNTSGMGKQLVDGKFPDSAVFGTPQSSGRLANGITLVGRIMGALGYTRGKNNLGETYFSLNSPTGERKRNMFADAVHFDPPKDAPELPKQFVSQIHLDDLKTTHPKLGGYIEAFMLAAPDPLEGLENLLTKLWDNQDLTEEEAQQFLEAAAKCIKERPWKIPLEVATPENWNAEVARLEEVIAEHKADPTEASQYAVWTIFNGLRVNHEAFLTGNIWDTMLCHIIAGRKVIDVAGTELSHISEATGGVEFGGLMQAAVAAISRAFTFKCPDGREFVFNGEGPFVEYIERTVIKRRGEWVRLNDAFLPGNAKQVFQSTMPETREKQGWSERMKAKFLSNPQELLRECKQNGWTKAEAMLKKLV